MNTPVLETERLILRPLSVADAPAVFEWTSDARVTRYLPYARHTRISVTEEWLASLDSEENAWYVGIERRADRMLIGSASVTLHTDTRQWEVGYNFRFDAWGQGFATETLQRLMQFACTELSAEHFIAKHAVDNTASGRVLAKCGFIHDHYGTYTSLDGLRTFNARFLHACMAQCASHGASRCLD